MTRPGTEPATGIDRVLVVAAHPDDVDFGAAATIAACTDAGVEVAYCIATLGDAGGFDETPASRFRRCGSPSSGPRPSRSGSPT